MNGVALFAGYGGLELGIDAAFDGVRTVCYVEREAYAASTLVARMEESSLDKAPIWDDVTIFDGRPWRGKVDIISGGFPCQPFSAAGKQKGMQDERWLWNDIARIIREVRPRWFVGENVPGLVRLGLEPVLRSFAEMGYDVSWGAFRADEVGAAHRRERVFILAQRRDCVGDSEGAGAGQAKRGVRNDSDRADWELADDNGGRGRQGCGTAESEGSRLESRGEELADAECRRGTSVNGQPHGRQRHSQGLSAAEHLSGQLADAASERRSEGFSCHASEAHHYRSEELAGVIDRRPLFAPGPADIDLWARVLAEAPSLEPSLCRMVDGSAERLDHRQDRLRSCGNGVVPLQAAVALRVLADRAGWTLR